MTLSWVLFYSGGAVFVAVMALTLWALFAPREWRAWAADHRVVIGGGIIFPVVALTGLLWYAFGVSAAASRHGSTPSLRIEVTGQQWWWRVHYLDEHGAIEVATANEIRIPVRRVVELALESADVIHSFWVPNLGGKLDMIPGRTNRLQITADREGLMRGQCAEYCGGPHGQMALYVVAMSEEAFEAWRTAQRGTASEPTDAPALRGRALFMQHCAACHTVRGTEARGRLGPDLTHVASRTSLGAGILPNDPESLARWIRRSQQIKPGNLMPSMDLFSGEELRGLVAYVNSLR